MKYLKIFEAFSKDKKIDKVNKIVDVFHTTKWLDSNLELTFEDGEYYFWYHGEKVIIVAKPGDKYHSQPEEKDEWRAIVSRLIIVSCLRERAPLTPFRLGTHIQYCLRKYLSNKLKEELGSFHFTMEIFTTSIFELLYTRE